MEKLIIEGGIPLHGTVRSSGAKNAALPILLASILAEGEHRFVNVPDLADVSHVLSLLGRIGCPSLHTSDPADGSVRIDASRIAFCEAPYDVVRKMRASVLVLGPLLARHGEARVSLPGGCAIGTRPIDLHLRGLEALGCHFELKGGMIHGTAPNGLTGADIHLDFPTVGGTENIVMAATLARGVSQIRNAAREPEIVDLCNFLVTLGARIEGAGTSTITVHGVEQLHASEAPYSILPDRIETGTYLCAAAVTGGDVTVTHTDPHILTTVLDALRDAGCTVETTDTTIRCIAPEKIQAFDLQTLPYPGFPTDMQAQLMVVACLAQGRSIIEETIFENRFMHVAELRRMGADIENDSRTATIIGQDSLQPASVMASDLRASAALVLAALSTSDLSEVLRIYHLDRGYEDLVGKLRALGARIARVNDAIDDRAALKRVLDRVEHEGRAPLSAIA